MYPFCDKILARLSTDKKTDKFCLPDKVLMVDDYPMGHVFNRDHACYFPESWRSEMTLPNASNVIPDIVTTLIPFILSVRCYASVKKYLQGHHMDGKFKCLLLEKWHTKRILQGYTYQESPH